MLAELPTMRRQRLDAGRRRRRGGGVSAAGRAPWRARRWVALALQRRLTAHAAV
jgi:hypothetical protein